MKTLLVFLISISLAVLNAEAELRWKFVPGDSYRYQLTQTAQLESGSGAQPDLIADVVEQIEFAWNVLEVDADGTAKLSITVDSYSLTAKGPDGQEAVYESQSEEDPQGYAAMLLPIGRRLTEEQVEVSMTPRGEVEILNIPSDLSEAVKSIPGGKQFAQDGGANSFASLARLGGPVLLPSSGADERTTWIESTDLEIPGQGKAVAEFSYKMDPLTEKKLIVIEQEMKLSLYEGKEPLNWSLSEQTSSGKVHFDAEAGRPEKSTLNYEAVLSASNSGGEDAPNLRLKQSLQFTSLSDASQ